MSVRTVATSLASEEPTPLCVDTAALMEEFATIEIERRRLVGKQCSVLAQLDECDFSEHGHRSVRGVLYARFQWSPAEATQRLRIARAGRGHPRLLEDLAEGHLPVAHAEQLALHLLQHSTLVERPHFDIELEHWLRRARYWEFDRYWRKLAEWGMIADPDDTEQAAETQHRARSVSIRRRGDGMYEIGGLLDPDTGAKVMDRWAQQADCEFEVDWNAATACQPDSAEPVLPRTDAQRNADAFIKLVLGTTPSSGDGVIIVVDEQTLTAEIARRAVHVQTTAAAEWVEPTRRACRTASGYPVTPAAALDTLLTGWFRTTVVDSTEKAIKISSKQRAYHGPMAEVVRALNTRCMWPGCRASARRSHIDHNHEFHAGGGTDLANTEGLLCARHNNLKHERKLTAVRRLDGVVTFYDRSERDRFDLAGVP